MQDTVIKYTLGARIEAAFAPRVGDNLQWDAPSLIGCRFEWEMSGTMDDGPYAGQTIWYPVDDAIRTGWVPFEDLSDVALIAPGIRD